MGPVKLVSVILKSLMMVKAASQMNVTADQKFLLMEHVNYVQNIRELRQMDNFADLITATLDKS